MFEKDTLKSLIESHLPEDWKGGSDWDEKLDGILHLVQEHFSPEESAALGRGAMKNMNDTPMFVSWIARAMATLSTKPLEKLITNLILGTAIGRKQSSQKNFAEFGYAGPITMVINPTMRCNIRCTGCYSFNYVKSQDMDYALLSKVLTEAREMGIRFITVSGGEPLLYPDLFRMAEEFSDLMFMMYTNGTQIDEAMTERIRDMGNILPAISVEGFEEETDSRRGKGVHEAVCSAMESLRRAGVFFGFSATPTSMNADILSTDAFLDEYMNRGALFGWLFNYIPVGRKPDLNLMPSPEQRNGIREAALRWQKTKPIFIGDFWNNGASVGGCLSASRYCYITVEGYVQPCTFVPFYTHNIQEHTLQEIFESHFFKTIRGMQPYHSNLLRTCKIIDHPEDLRHVVSECCAKPSYDGAEQILENQEVVDFLDRYSEEYGEIADRVWKGPDYQNGRSCIAQFLGRINVDAFFDDRMENAHRVTREKEIRKRTQKATKEVA